MGEADFPSSAVCFRPPSQWRSQKLCVGANDLFQCRYFTFVTDRRSQGRATGTAGEKFQRKLNRDEPKYLAVECTMAVNSAMQRRSARMCKQFAERCYSRRKHGRHISLTTHVETNVEVTLTCRSGNISNIVKTR